MERRRPGGGGIRLSPDNSKTSEGRVLPIKGAIAGVIRRRLSVRVVGLPWVFHRPVGMVVKRAREVSESTLNVYWRLACVAAGRPGKLLHDCRRTTVRDLTRSGVPDRVAMQVTGHKSRAVFDRYNIVSEDELAHALERRDDYLARKKKG